MNKVLLGLLLELYWERLTGNGVVHSGGARSARGHYHRSTVKGS